MSARESDFTLLLQATVKIYRVSFLEALRGLRHSWWACLFPLLYLPVLMVSALVFPAVLGGLLGGLVLGLITTLLLSHYLGLVGLCVRLEKTSLRQSWETAKDLFFPLMGLLFSFFILNMVADAALGRPDQRWLRSSLNLVVFILFNPLPEVLYLRRSPLTVETFGESLEFVKQNFVEWFLPMAVLVIPVIISNPVGLLLALGYADPLQIGFSAALLSATSSLLLSIVLLPVIFLLMAFRGALFLKLAGSTRRKRIYQQRFGG